MNELLENFFELLRGFVCHGDHSTDQDMWDLGCLPVFPKPCFGREGSCGTSVSLLGSRLGDQGGSQCVDTKHSFGWVAVFRQGGLCHCSTHSKAFLP